MKNLRQILTAVCCIIGLSTFAQDKSVIGNHFDVIQRFSDIRSHSEQIIREVKKWKDANKIAEAQTIYFGVKSKGDGVASRYKSIIQNPKLAKKQKENIRVQLNELIEEHNNLVKFYQDNYKTFVVGSSFAIEGWMIEAVKEIATAIIKEIKKAVQEKKDQMKKEVDDNILRNWDDIK